MYIFAFIYTLFIPIMMIGMGYLWKVKPPKNINSMYGYRTSLSMKSQAHWDYAHYVCSKVFIVVGVISLLVSLPYALSYGNMTIDVLEKKSAIPLYLQSVLLVSIIFPVEIALRRKFFKKKTHQEEKE